MWRNWNKFSYKKSWCYKLLTNAWFKSPGDQFPLLTTKCSTCLAWLLAVYENGIIGWWSSYTTYSQEWGSLEDRGDIFKVEIAFYILILFPIVWKKTCVGIVYKRKPCDQAVNYIRQGLYNLYWTNGQTPMVALLGTGCFFLPSFQKTRVV